MKLKIALSFFLLLTIFSYSQVGIGTTAPASSSMLDISSINKGILIPRVDLGDLNSSHPIDNPEKSLLLWNTDAAGSGVKEGFYFWNGYEWSKLGDSSRPKIIADKFNSNDVSINANKPVAFDSTTISEGISNDSNTYFTIPKSGYYRVSFSLSIEKRGNGASANGIYSFYLSKIDNPSGRINGTTIRTEIPNQFSVASVFLNKIVYLEADDKLYLMSQRNVDILSDSNFNVEFIHD